MATRKKPAKAVAEPLATPIPPEAPEAPSEAENAPEAVSEPQGGNTVTNCVPGTILSLGDGRSLAFGESAEVSGELKAFLRERGQAE